MRKSLSEEIIQWQGVGEAGLEGDGVKILEA